jgi:hypothetical protein
VGAATIDGRGADKNVENAAQINLETSKVEKAINPTEIDGAITDGP